MQKLFEHRLRRACERTPNKTAIVAEDRRMTYAEFESRSNAFAAGLGRLGMRLGERIAVHTGNTAVSAVFPV